MTSLQKNPFFPKTESPSNNSLSATPACQTISQPTSNGSHPSVPPGLRHRDPAHNDLSDIPAWRSVLLTGLRHGDPAHRYLSGTPACKSISQPTSNRSHHSIPPSPRHGDPAYKGFSAIPAWQSITQPISNRSHPSFPPGLRHGDPTHNALSAIPACQTGHLSTLRHGDPQQKVF